MLIAIPKEIMEEEKRVAATPETTEKLIKLGFKVILESNAGAGIFYSDEDYRSAGAEIVADAETLYGRADIILKVKEPRYNVNAGKHEVEMMKDESILIAFLHPATPSNHSLVKMLRDKKITSLTMDGIPRTPNAQKMDALTSMSTVTGYKAVLLAANRLQKFVPMIGTAIGPVRPSRFLVVGAGVVGLQAIATAKRLGGMISAVDIRQKAREEATSLGAAIGGFDVPGDLALGRGGYAKSLPAEWLEKEREALRPLMADADVVILSALVPGEVAPVLVTDEMIASMKPGSVIVDVSIDQGGNCAVTEAGRHIVRHNVTIDGLQNIPGRVAIHSTWLYATNMYYYVENLFKGGDFRPDLEDEIVRSSLVTHEGRIVHQGTLKAMDQSN
ncbi:MAG TPA: NAD(P) transhydrogenase subunit alpha [Bacteroidales bacterium]|jgi:NAD(P) transhydrogenase subunit alpha|nr:NAD(P) transhydrogenase subunit alpha [Bacteroidales bacterium]HQH24051.1 NAD(P) transhydrogenase subunit alpha [Bacteroidales bacterium]HQJ83214.1 NAD(P) transhydrogenase subunit alpha [Bacteroidales bacterium]